MAISNTRAEFTDYCLRRLGAPVIDINLDDDQISDRIDDALQYFADYHYDATQKVYYIKLLNQTDIDNRYVDLSPSVTTDANGKQLEIIGVSRIFPISDSQATVNMFDLRYQLRLNELYDFTSASYINYTLTMQHLRSLELLFTGSVPIRYQRHMHKLFIDWAWGSSQTPVGTVVVAECTALVNNETYGSVWNDRWLKEYATNLMKKQWGTNLKKFGQVKLPGGIVLNGKELYDEADEEIKKLEAEMIDRYQLPIDFMMN